MSLSISMDNVSSFLLQFFLLLPQRYFSIFLYLSIGIQHLSSTLSSRNRPVYVLRSSSSHWLKVLLTSLWIMQILCQVLRVLYAHIRSFLVTDSLTTESLKDIKIVLVLRRIALAIPSMWVVSCLLSWWLKRALSIKTHVIDVLLPYLPPLSILIQMFKLVRAHRWHANPIELLVPIPEYLLTLFSNLWIETALVDFRINFFSFHL